MRYFQGIKRIFSVKDFGHELEYQHYFSNNRSDQTHRVAFIEGCWEHLDLNYTAITETEFKVIQIEYLLRPEL